MTPCGRVARDAVVREVVERVRACPNKIAAATMPRLIAMPKPQPASARRRSPARKIPSAGEQAARAPASTTRAMTSARTPCRAFSRPLASNSSSLIAVLPIGSLSKMPMPRSDRSAARPRSCSWLRSSTTLPFSSCDGLALPVSAFFTCSCALRFAVSQILANWSDARMRLRGCPRRTSARRSRSPPARNVGARRAAPPQPVSAR